MSRVKWSVRGIVRVHRESYEIRRPEVEEAEGRLQRDSTQIALIIESAAALLTSLLKNRCVSGKQAYW